MQQIVLASNNQGKIDEFNAIFNRINIEIIPQAKFNVPEIDEPYCTFIENSLHKARHCSKYSNLPVLADDSGICVNALNGRPGVLSARYSGTQRDSLRNNLKLVEELKPFDNKSAYYYCLLTLIRSANDPQPIFADGILAGEIVDTPRGNNGFGYDPHMFLTTHNKTVAELSNDEKNLISHRYKAIMALMTKLADFKVNAP
jgi:XTP/dITP diphosphohydrolase